MDEFARADRDADVGRTLAHGLEEHEIARLDLILVYLLAGLVLLPRLARQRPAVLREHPLDEAAAIESARWLTAAVPVGRAS